MDTLHAFSCICGLWHTCHLASAAAAKSCPTLCDPIDGSPPGSARDSPDKNTGVGCHFLLQRVKGKSESEVAQFCLTLSDPMDCSLPGSSVHGIFQARVLKWGAIAFSLLMLSIVNSFPLLYGIFYCISILHIYLFN